jgi:dTDP-4-dehydrorhamnose 3,5-epimerase
LRTLASALCKKPAAGCSPCPTVDGMQPLGIEGAWTFTPRIHEDHRGSFLEWFRGAEIRADLGYSPSVAQANCSVSRRGVVRGIHFADVPPGQAKYIGCLSGAIVDVVVDLRVSSPSFARWEAVRLDDQSRRAVFIGEGLGHGFVTLSDEATVIYLCSTPYRPGSEHGVHPLDPEIGIDWPGEPAPVLSDRDAAAPTLAEARAAGLLPGYADCVAYTAELRAAELRAAELRAAEPAASTTGNALRSVSRQSAIG